jgi:hypothetical protein
MGIRDKPIAPGSPWQNAFVERLIGSIRRECVDYIVVLGEAHLSRMPQSYARYYNEIRTHRSLNHDAPLTRPVQRSGMPWSAGYITNMFESEFSAHTGSNLAPSYYLIAAATITFLVVLRIPETAFEPLR